MKINKNIWILIVIAALIIANVVDYKLGTHIYPLLFLVILIALLVYLLILAKRYVDAKVQESNASTNMNALKESLDRIEWKLDKIDKMLEKVSD